MTLFWLKIVSFLDLLGVGLMIPVLSGHVRDLGGTHITVGLLQSVYAGCQMISGPVIGSLSDLKGRKKILFWTLILSGPLYLALGFTSSVYIIILARAGLGIFKQTQTLIKALVPDYVDHGDRQLSAIYGEMSAYTGAGVTIGPLIGGHIMVKDPVHGFALIGIIVFFLFLFNAGIIYWLEPPPLSTRKFEHRRRRRRFTTCVHSLPRPPDPLRGQENNDINIFHLVFNSFTQSIFNLMSIEWSQYWDIFLTKGLIGFIMSNYYANYTHYLKITFGLNAKKIGYIISFQAITASLSSYFMGAINKLYPNDIYYRTRVTHIFLMITFALIGLIASSSIKTYTCFLIPLAAGNSIGRNLLLEMALNRCNEDNRASLIGVSNSVRSMAGVIAPMNAGFLASYCGVQYVIYGSLLMSLIGLMISFTLYYFDVVVVNYNQRDELGCSRN